MIKPLILLFELSILLVLFLIIGFQIVYNLSQPLGSRVESLKVRCNECRVPVYEDIILDKTYRLILNSFLKDGGDGFEVLHENLKNIKIGRVDADVCAEYLAAKSPIIQERDGRLEFVGEEVIEYINLDS